MSRDAMKKSFINYLKMTYGAESTQVAASLPPLRPAFNFPAFQKQEEGFGQLAGLPQPGMGLGAPQLGQPQRRPDVQAAQRTLLGGGGY